MEYAGELTRFVYQSMRSIPMTDPNFIILYVDSPESSAQFYHDLLGKAPVELSATFAMFVLASGVKLGLWSRHTVEPSTPVNDPLGGGGELAFAVSNSVSVEDIYSHWCQLGLAIIQSPTVLDFGYTFVAIDPDGHRLRVFTPGEQ